MGDLSNRDSSLAVRIVGAEPDGTETDFLKVNEQGEIKVSNFPNLNYQSAVKTISTTEALASVGLTNLTGRKTLIIYNKGAQDIFYGPSGVTDLTGIPIFKDEIASFDVGDIVNIFLVTKTGNATVVIQELS